MSLNFGLEDIKNNTVCGVSIEELEEIKSKCPSLGAPNRVKINTVSNKSYIALNTTLDEVKQATSMKTAIRITQPFKEAKDVLIFVRHIVSIEEI